MNDTPAPPIPGPTPIELDQLDVEACSGWRLRPDGLLSGGSAAAALAHGQALPLAGGDVAFTIVEVLTRTERGVVAAQAPLRRLRWWAGQQGEGLRDRIETQLARLAEKRQAWAGLNLDRALIMGILNVTPDSLYAGTGTDSDAAIARGRALLAAGADIVDIGAESTRPGATPVSPDDEARRLEPVVRALASAGAVISVDTRRAPVMKAALSWGARAINDVAALEGDGSLETAARAGAPVILMHMRGEPATMQDDPRYDLASLDVADYLAKRIVACEEAGVPLHRIVVDPGIGFGKTPGHNLEILARLTLFQGLGCGVAVGLSRKSTIGRVAGGVPVEDRLPGSLAGALQALRQGAQILRVHDVAETRQAVAVWRAIATGA
jgi:dihydropteroate synthase